MDRLFSDTRFAVVLGVAVAVTAVVYVAFGPPSGETPLSVRSSPRRKKGGKRRRLSGEPHGLHNAGNTCFVNAVLQAIGACPAMILWLVERKEELFQLKQHNLASYHADDGEDALTHLNSRHDDMNVLQLSLLRVLNVANGGNGLTGEEEYVEEKVRDPEIWAPAALFRALRVHRWVINTDEQDAHEFLQVLLSTVEEELQKNEQTARPASLFDTVGIDHTVASGNENFEGGALEDESKDTGTPNKTPDSSDPMVGDGTLDICNIRDEDDVKGEDDKIRTGCRSKKRPSRRHRQKYNRSSSGVFVRSGEELPLETVLKQTRLAASSSTPFTGTLTNKLSFRGTGKCKSPTSSTVFNNITLTLPNSTIEGVSNAHSWVSGVKSAPVTLETLLQMFVSVETVSSSASDDKENTEGNLHNASKSRTQNSVNLSSGNDISDLVKQLTFARLPDCLCFHIQRTAFENGIPRKRNDPVLFPSLLNMDNYVYTRQLSKKRILDELTINEKDTGTSTSGSNIQTPLDAETPSYASSGWLMSPDDNSLMLSSISSQISDISKYSYNNNFQLRAVVVHLGAIDSGHYVTYRREAENSLSTNESIKARWFYTSDSLVREVTLDEVLNTNPYMLFYEKVSCADTKVIDITVSSPDSKDI